MRVGENQVRCWWQGAAATIPLNAAAPLHGAMVFVAILWGLLILPTAAQAQFRYTTNNGSITITAYSGLGGAVTIPSTTNGFPVGTIAGKAFFNRSSITSVTIPASVTNIQEMAFARCRSLTAITVAALNPTFSSVDGVLFNKSQTTLLQYPAGKTGSYVIPDGVTNIANWAFHYSSSLTNLTLPAGILTIGKCAFRKCTKLVALAIPASVTSVGEGAFSFCTAFSTVALPDNVDNIGNYTFLLCTNLTSVAIGSDVTNIGESAFYGCIKLPSVTIPDGVANIADDAFFYCPGMTNLIIPVSVTNIGDRSFARCIALTSVTIPNTVTTIGNYAFSECSSMSTVALVNGITNIGEGAFSCCTSLTNFTIPASLSNIGDAAFSACDNLSAITVEALNPSYSSVDGALFDENQTVLLLCPEGKSGTYTVPNNVTSIASNAFSCCLRLTNVTIGSSIANIGIGAFSDCFNLSAITVNSINPTYSTVDGVLFNKDQTLLIQCPGSIAGSYIIPNTVTNIGEGAFAYSTNLSGLYFRGPPPSIVPPGPFYSQFPNPLRMAVYYLPGTFGWTVTFGHGSDFRPTALWKPQVQTSDAGFGIRTNQFGFNISWASGMVVVVETCTDLANQIWSPLLTNTLAGDSFYFSDPEWMSVPGRFYRLSSPISLQ